MTQKGDLQEMGLEKSGSFATKDNGHSSHASCLHIVISHLPAVQKVKEDVRYLEVFKNNVVLWLLGNRQENKCTDVFCGAFCITACILLPIHQKYKKHR